MFFTKDSMTKSILLDIDYQLVKYSCVAAEGMILRSAAAGGMAKEQ